MTKFNPNPAEEASKGVQSARIRAMQNPLDRALYHPIAGRLARVLAPTSVTPNMVSVGGGIMIVLAGFAYVQQGWLWPVLVGLLLHMAWHVLDGADGDLARLTGKSSPAGEIVDGLCDYLGHFLLYNILALTFFANEGWIMIIAAIIAGISRIAQASFYEAQRRQFLAWAFDVPWLRTTKGAAEKAGLGSLGRAYVTVTKWVAPGNAAIDEAIADPITRDAMRLRLRELGPSAFAGSSLLGANYRTLALGASMLAGSPLWYFLYEGVALNLVLVHSQWKARRTMAGLADSI